jgi:hypothetical protein
MMALSLVPSLCFAFLMAYSTALFLITNLLSLLSGTHQAPFDITQQPLTLSSSFTFKLAIFSDLHYGEEEHGWGIDQDRNSTRVMRRILCAEAPDLVVLNGDLITGENTFRENSSDYVHQIVAPMVTRGVPWASTYGNHDSKFNLSRERTFAVEKTYPLSYTQRMDGKLPGVTNYYLLLYRHGQSSMSDDPVAVLWFFDSRGGATYGLDHSDKDDIPNWVAPETAHWFRTEASALRTKYGRVLPGVAFVHIPPVVFLSAQRKGLDPALFPGVNDDVPVAIQGTGTEDREFVEALRDEGMLDGLHSVYVGHDHGNAWCGLFPTTELTTRRRGGNGEAPFLCFGKHTGYGGYGSWNRGSRVVQLKFVDKNGNSDFSDPGEMEVETWVRMESGQIVTHVALNETYGLDRYPTANGEPHG